MKLSKKLYYILYFILVILGIFFINMSDSMNINDAIKWTLFDIMVTSWIDLLITIIFICGSIKVLSYFYDQTYNEKD